MPPRDVVERIRERPLALACAFVVRVYRVMVERFARNDLLTYASAIAFQLLTALIPLALLAFLLVGAFGDQGVWRDELAPRLSGRVSGEVYGAVDVTVEGLIRRTHPQWIAFAVALVLWEVSGSVRAATGALDRIFEREETRSIQRRFGVSFVLAAAVSVCVLGALLVATRGGGWVDLGAAQPLWTAVRWGTVLVLLWAVVALLLRFAPDAQEDVGWVTLGGVLVVVSWVGATVVFGWWVTSAADYRTPFGAAVALLTLVGYLYTTAIVFLVGAQVDRLLIEQAGAGRGPLDGLG